jgi:hypothetical protein
LGNVAGTIPVSMLVKRLARPLPSLHCEP